MKTIVPQIIFVIIFFVKPLSLTAQKTVPINFEREVSYGKCHYSDIVIDSLETTINGYFVSNGNSSVWIDFTEHITYNEEKYELVYSNLPKEEYRIELENNDTLFFTDVFMPIKRYSNGNITLQYCDNDSILFQIFIPPISNQIDAALLSQSLQERAKQCVNDSDYVSCARSIRLLCELNVPFDSLTMSIIQKDINANLSRVYSPGYESIINDNVFSCRSLFGAESCEYAEALCDSLYEKREYNAVITLLSNVDSNKKHSKDFLTRLAICYYSIGDYVNAINTNLQIRELCLSDSLIKSELPYVYSRLFDCHRRCNEFDKAILYGEKVLEMSEDDPVMKYQILYRLGSLYFNDLNLYTRAKYYFGQWEKHSASYSDLLDNSWDDYFEKREFVAGFYIKIGDDASALVTGYQTKNEIEDMLGTDNWYYALCLNNLANAYSGLGEVEKSVELEKQSLDIRVKLYNQGQISSMSIARAAHNLSTHYNGIDSLDAAFRYIKMAVDYADSISDVKLYTYLAYASLYEQIEEYDSAEVALNEAARLLNLLKESDDSIDCWSEEVAVLTAFANIKRKAGHNKEAVQDYSKIIELYKQKDVSGLDLANIIDKEIFCYYWLRKDNTVKKLLEKRYEQTRNAIREAFVLLPSQQRINFMSQIESKLDMLINYCDYIQHKNTAELAYNLALLRKGLLLQAETDFTEYLQETGDSVLISIYRKCADYQKEINKHGIIENSSDSLNRDYERNQFDLSRLLQRCGDYTRKLFVNWEDVSKSLKEDEVAIEILTPHYQANEEYEDPYNYCAVILKKNYKSPHYITLTAIEPVDEIEEDELYGSTKLYDLIWKPLRKELKGISKIYFSPDSKLHQIAIEYAMCPDGKRMNEHYQIYRLSSTRELTRKKTEHKSFNAKLYGGLVYSADRDDIISESSKYHQDKSCNRSVFSPSDSMYRAGVKYLPGTKIEVEDIQHKLLQKNHACSLYEGLSGTEESFYALEGENFDILHLATHGFYWTGDDMKKYKNLDFLSTENNNEYEDTSLLRSGLFLSGANITLKGEELPENIEDGILTAQELSLMNLSNVDLAVLSACQSGLGEVTGEGVFGLQRGFKLAGVNSLLMSLWPVDDTATQLLMVEFYKHHLRGETKIESLKKAQQYVKSQLGYEDPEYWAGFILLDALN